MAFWQNINEFDTYCSIFQDVIQDLKDVQSNIRFSPENSRNKIYLYI